LVDGDVAQGAEIAGNATTYNYLRHAQFQDIADRLEQCTTPSCRDNIIDKALALSQQQDLEALQLCASGSSGCGDAVLASMTTPFEGVEFSKPETAASLRELMWENPGKNGAFAMAAANQDAATVVDALDPEDRLSPEQRAQAEETLAGVMSSGGIGADRGGYTGGRGVTKPSTGASGSGGKVDAGFPKGTFSKVAPAITKQLQKKFKHAEDFGVSGNYSPANAKKFNQAIQDHLNASGTKEISGMYRGHSVTFHTDSNSGLTVIQNPNGSFLSGWRLNSQQLQHVLKDGKL
ncbi:colicin D domain-containing protein, partial [Salinicola socius]